MKAPSPVSSGFTVFYSAAFIAASVVSSAMAGTADHSQAQEEIVVQAFRLPSQLSETGSSIWIVDEALIRERGYVYMTDVLTSVPGVTVNQNGPFGGQATARIRGASSDQTLVLIDGVMVNDTSTPGGGFNFGVFDVSDVARVEVLKGPQSTLWGTDAIGGVINIVSKTPEPGLNGDVSLTGGSFDTRQYRASIEGAGETGDFRISINDISTDGISRADENDGNTEEDGYDAQTVSFKGGINLPADARLLVSYRRTDSETEFDSFGVMTGVQDGNELSENELTTAQVSLTLPLFDERLQNTLRYGEMNIVRDNYVNDAFSFGAEGERRLMQYQGTLAVSDQQQLAFGIEKEETDDSIERFSNTGIYALYQLSPIDSLTLSLGIRQDDHDEYGSETVGRLSAAWAVTDSLDIRASWGEGFKAPTIFQTTFFCCGATGPNTNLKPEFSEAFDIGFDWQLPNERGSMSVTAFQQDTRDQINFSFAVGGFENIDEVESRGLELAVDYQLSGTLFASANVTYLDSRDGNGNALVQIPDLAADVALKWQPRPTLSTTLSMTYNDEQQDIYGIVDSWTRIDLSAMYNVNDHVRLFGRIENLGDTDYQRIFGYGTPERSGYLGVTYSF